jgi:hypothetical protein
MQFFQNLEEKELAGKIFRNKGLGRNSGVCQAGSPLWLAKSRQEFWRTY